MPIYLPCLLHDSFVHFHNTLSNLLIYSLIHDKEKTHKKLVEKLGLKSVSYSSSELKGLADSENPLDPVNRIHCLLKMFLNAHSGFCRDEIQDYLNLYSFVINSPSDHLEKVEKIINLVFENLNRVGGYPLVE